ncbi:MAG: NAD(P)/FAD-dependent oxidoreductase [Caldisericia bacterium]|nr:NAD(P)/FAD-dependent oxidoreductase [Caldisericia bacterium]
MEKNYDVIIGGGGIVGANIFRELSKYELKILLIEKECDVASFGSTIANTGIIHGGYDPIPGSLKALFNSEGKKLWRDLTEKLHIDSEFNGVLVLAYTDEEEKFLYELYERGIKNKVNVEIIDKNEIKRLEPNLKDTYKKGLLSPDAGIIDPFIATINLVRSGYLNGGEVLFSCEIKDLINENGWVIVITNKGDFKTKIFVNALGFFGKKFLKKDEIFPRRGQYLITDKSLKGLVSRPIFGVPTEKGKGISITPTPYGNLLLGPTSHIVNSYDTSSYLKEREEILERISNFIDFDFSNFIIRDFTGVRASSKRKDFIIEFDDNSNILHVQGIDSPGLTASPAIARYVSDLIKERISLKEKKDFIESIEKDISLKNLTKLEIDELIKKNPSYGEIICRCEFVSKGEILQTLKNFPEPKNIDGLKRRLRVTSGRCQGSFCTIRILKILNEEKKIPFEKIKKKGSRGVIVYGEIE